MHFPPYSGDILLIVSRTYEISHPYPKNRHHDICTFPAYSLDILLIVSRTYAFSSIFSAYSLNCVPYLRNFPPISKKQAPWRWHISRIFHWYSINCCPYPWNFPTHIKKTSSSAPPRLPRGIPRTEGGPELPRRSPRKWFSYDFSKTRENHINII